eukprot:scaffold30872_cov160-Skeletonema_menzelii.AAC.1
MNTKKKKPSSDEPLRGPNSQNTLRWTAGSAQLYQIIFRTDCLIAAEKEEVAACSSGVKGMLSYTKYK